MSVFDRNSRNAYSVQVVVALPVSWSTDIFQLAVSETGCFMLRVTTILSILSFQLYGAFVNMESPCFTLPEVQRDGSTRRRCIHDRLIPWQQYQVITFLTPTCVDCNEQANDFNVLAKRAGTVATSRAILSSNSSGKMKQFLAAHSKDRFFNITLDRGYEASRSFQVTKFPTTLILNRYDRVSYVKEGLLTSADQDEILQKIMQKDLNDPREVQVPKLSGN